MLHTGINHNVCYKQTLISFKRVPICLKPIEVQVRHMKFYMVKVLIFFQLMKALHAQTNLSDQTF